MKNAATLDSGIQRIVRDNVVTGDELAFIAGLDEVKANPGGVPAKLDQYAGIMTPGAQDRYRAFEAALGTPPAGGGSALDILSGKIAVKPTLPAWLPANLDFQAGAAGFKQILGHQAQNRGKQPDDFAPGSVTSIDFWDIDLTTKDTDSPVPMVDINDPTHYLTYPDAPDVPEKARGRIVYLGIGSGEPTAPGRDFGTDLSDLKNCAIDSIRNMPWANFKPSFVAFADPEPLLRSKTIKQDLDEMLAAQKNPKSRMIVNTARSDAGVPAFITDAMLEQGVDVNGAMCVNNPAMMASLQMTAAGLTSAEKKAIGMAMGIYAYGPENLERVRFFDDTDANQIAAMQLLPKLFPNIEFEFVGVKHKGSKFRQKLDARTERGDLVASDGKPMSVKARDGYTTVQGKLPFEKFYGLDPDTLPKLKPAT